MNILNEVVRGAANQFGREFGRAGANAVLKGGNYYTIQSSDYSGRIKPSDSDLVRAIKEINKIKFVTTDKANVSRLIDLTDLVLNHLEFNGTESLNQISDIKTLIDNYNDKFEHGSTLVSDSYKDKSKHYLEQKRQAFVDGLNDFNSRSKAYVKKNLAIATANRKSKTTATILACPLLIGMFGAHKWYLKEYGYGFAYIIFAFVFGLSFLFALVNFFQFIFMSEEKFDIKYNPAFYYFSKFSFSEE